MSPSFAAAAHSSTSTFRVAVIGGGISGLAAAHRLLEIRPDVQCTLLESAARVGGTLETIHEAGYQIERSADMFTTREPWALNLCKRIGIEQELIETTAGKARRAFVVRKGKLVPVPEGFTLMSPVKIWPIAKTPLLSPMGKLRLASEFFVKRKAGKEDESLKSFVTRRFGKEAFDRLVQPLIGGIYTADPAKLSMQATMPQFVQLEEQFGSLIRGMQTQQRAKKTQVGSGARYGMFLAPRAGMGRLPAAVAAKLPEGTIRLNSAVTSINRSDAGWHVHVEGAASAEFFDAVIFATPGPVLTRLLSPTLPKLGGLFEKCEHASCSVATLGVQRDQITHPLDGFGFVVPAIERRQILAGSFSSVKFAGRAPNGSVLLRVFVGGALQPQLARLPEDEIRQIVLRELEQLIGLTGKPQFFKVMRWLQAMPQYHVGHLQRVEAIAEALRELPNLAIAGNTLEGVGVPFCVHTGELAAEKIAQFLPGTSSTA